MFTYFIHLKKAYNRAATSFQKFLRRNFIFLGRNFYIAIMEFLGYCKGLGNNLNVIYPFIFIYIIRNIQKICQKNSKKKKIHVRTCMLEKN